MEEEEENVNFSILALARSRVKKLKLLHIGIFLVMKIEVDCRTFLLLERNFNNFSIIVIFYTEIWRKKLFL